MNHRSILFGLVCCITLIGSEIHAATPSKNSDDRIRMAGSLLGIRTNTAQQDLEITFTTAINEVMGASGNSVSFVVYPTTQDLYAAFDNGQVDGIFGTIIEYMGREDRLAKTKQMALGRNHRALKQCFVVLVRKSDGISQLRALKGKRLTLAKYQDLEGVYLNTLLLKDQLAEIPGFFSTRLDAKNPNVAIMDVFFDKSDATIVSESEYLTAIELNPQIGNKLLVLEKSPPYVLNVGSVRKELSGEKLDAMIQSLKRIADTEKGRKVLSFSNANSIDTVADEELLSARDLINEYEVLKRTRNQSAGKPLASTKRRANADAQ